MKMNFILNCLYLILIPSIITSSFFYLSKIFISIQNQSSLKNNNFKTSNISASLKETNPIKLSYELNIPKESTCIFMEKKRDVRPYVSTVYFLIVFIHSIMESFVLIGQDFPYRHRMGTLGV